MEPENLPLCSCLDFFQVKQGARRVAQMQDVQSDVDARADFSRGLTPSACHLNSLLVKGQRALVIAELLMQPAQHVGYLGHQESVINRFGYLSAAMESSKSRFVMPLSAVGPAQDVPDEGYPSAVVCGFQKFQGSLR